VRLFGITNSGSTDVFPETGDGVVVDLPDEQATDNTTKAERTRSVLMKVPERKSRSYAALRAASG